MATKVYTSAEFKRERDNFLSLIKNMEKADTKKWLDEVKETLFRSEDTIFKCKSKSHRIEFQGPRGRREEGRVHQAGGCDREAPGFDPQGAGDTSEKRGELTFPENKLIRALEILESSIRGNTQVPSDVGYMVRNLIREHFGECGVSFGDTD